MGKVLSMFEEMLSPMERKVARRIAKGESNKEISTHLDIAEPTVKAHVKSIFRTLRLKNRTLVAIWIIENGFDGGSAWDAGQ